MRPARSPGAELNALEAGAEVRAVRVPAATPIGGI